MSQISTVVRQHLRSNRHQLRPVRRLTGSVVLERILLRQILAQRIGLMVQIEDLNQSATLASASNKADASCVL